MNWVWVVEYSVGDYTTVVALFTGLVDALMWAEEEYGEPYASPKSKKKPAEWWGSDQIFSRIVPDEDYQFAEVTVYQMPLFDSELDVD